MSNRGEREQRQHNIFGNQGNKPGDQRKSFQIDRDRILYSSAFRRLAQVTQVVNTSERHTFHNRLTHSLKVAQVARRLAERLIAQQPEVAAWLGLDPDVVEAAALAHDLGHPPFGHIAEEELDHCARNSGLSDGFEGNAQSFRILTHLAIHRPDYRGLNLTRATLNAVLKYPWQRERTLPHPHNKKWRKYSVYDQDLAAFEFVRPDFEQHQTVEASIMDFADDITYSVHDLEDFYVAGLIPIELLANDPDEFDRFIKEWLQDPYYSEIAAIVQEQPRRFQSFLNATYNLKGQYRSGSFEHKAQIKRISSQLLQGYVQSVSLSDTYGEYGYLQRDTQKQQELEFLQRIVWFYVISNPRLASQRYGQRRIIKTLFEVYQEVIEHNDQSLIPARFLKEFRHLSALEQQGKSVWLEKVRMIIDIVASLSEIEAVLMYRKLTGINSGSFMDYLD